MSEFKFACPVCGQHVSAGPADSGKQIECPTCFHKMLVPEPPASASKLIRYAASAESSKRPGTEVLDQARLPTSRRSALPWPTIGLVGACILAGAIGYYFKDRLFPSKFSIVQHPESEATLALNSANIFSTNVFPWSLALTNASFPDQAPLGRLQGKVFQPSRTVLQGGVLSFRQGAPAELALVVMLHAAKGEDLAGKVVQIRSDQSPAPTIQVRWKGPDAKPVTQRHRGGYALKVAFGQPANGRMPGNIWLSLPDPDQGFLSGTFDAEIRKASPPKKPGPAHPPR